MTNSAAGGFPSYQDLIDNVNKFRQKAGTNIGNFARANPAHAASYNSAAGRFGVNVTDVGEGLARGLTGKAALGLGAAGAGLATALNGGGIAETTGAGGGAAVGTAIAGRLAPMLARGGPFGALAAGATALALPMITSSIGSGIGKGIDSRIEGPLAAGSEATAQRMLNPNSTSNVIDSSLDKLSKEELKRLMLIKQAGYDQVGLQALGNEKVVFPLMNKQFELRAKMLPLDTAARLAVNTNASIGNMYNTSIAGTSGIAQQIAANNPYGQVMV